jgi:hypothetical protein
MPRNPPDILDRRVRFDAPNVDSTIVSAYVRLDIGKLPQTKGEGVEAKFRINFRVNSTIANLDDCKIETVASLSQGCSPFGTYPLLY